MSLLIDPAFALNYQISPLTSDRTCLFAGFPRKTLSRFSKAHWRVCFKCCERLGPSKTNTWWRRWCACSRSATNSSFPTWRLSSTSCARNWRRPARWDGLCSVVIVFLPRGLISDPKKNWKHRLYSTPLFYLLLPVKCSSMFFFVVKFRCIALSWIDNL